MSTADQTTAPQQTTTEPSSTQQAQPRPGGVGAGQDAPRTATTEGATISQSELDRLRRIEQQYRGAAPRLQKLAEYGIATDDDLNGLVSLREKVGRLPQGISLDQMVEALAVREEKANPGQFDPNAIREVIRSEFQSRDTESATRSHRDAALRQVQHENELVGRLSSGMSEAHKRVVARAVREYADKAMGTYEAGHPLRESYLRPLSSDDFGAVESQVKAELTELLGQDFVELAAAASTARPASTAAPGGMGGPSQAANKQVSYRNRDMNEKKAVAAAILNRIGGAPVSQM